MSIFKYDDRHKALIAEINGVRLRTVPHCSAPALPTGRPGSQLLQVLGVACLWASGVGGTGGV